MTAVSGRYRVEEIALLGDLLEEFSYEVRGKAEDLIKASAQEPDLLRQDTQDPRVWWINRPPNVYRVQWALDEGGGWVTCTCPNGMNQSQPRCYHVAAVLSATRQAIVKALLERGSSTSQTLTASGTQQPAWRQRFERLWEKAAVPPEARPVVSLRGSAADVEARRYAAYVARSR